VGRRGRHRPAPNCRLVPGDLLRGRFFLYETYDSAEAFAEHRRSQHLRQNIETMRAPLLIEHECGFAGYIDNTMRDGEAAFG
jgi:hypothetical protein